MSREVIEVPVLSDAMRKRELPVSLVTRGGGLVFVSALPPLDVTTGAAARGGVEKQTKACLEAMAHCLAAAGSSPDKVMMVRIYTPQIIFQTAKIERAYAAFFPDAPPARTYVTTAETSRFPLQIECIALA